jgi:hypothetical protein
MAGGIFADRLRLGLALAPGAALVPGLGAIAPPEHALNKREQARMAVRIVHWEKTGNRQYIGESLQRGIEDARQGAPLI